MFCLSDINIPSDSSFHLYNTDCRHLSGKGGFRLSAVSRQNTRSADTQISERFGFPSNSYSPTALIRKVRFRKQRHRKCGKPSGSQMPNGFYGMQAARRPSGIRPTSVEKCVLRLSFKNDMRLLYHTPAEKQRLSAQIPKFRFKSESYLRPESAEVHMYRRSDHERAANAAG